MSIVLDTNQYESLFAAISMIKDQCTDINITNGIIRQRSDTEIVVYDIDVSDLLGDMNLPLVGIKMKADLLKMFVGNDEIEIDSNDDVYSIKDEFSKISFIVPNLQFIENKFVESNELAQMFGFGDRELVFTHNFSQKVCERMRVIANNYEIDAFTIEFNGDTATIKANTEAKDQVAVLASEIPLDIPISDRMCNIATTLLITEHDSELTFEMYTDGNNILISKVDSSIKGTNYTIHNRTRLMDMD